MDPIPVILFAASSTIKMPVVLGTVNPRMRKDCPYTPKFCKMLQSINDYNLCHVAFSDHFNDGTQRKIVWVSIFFGHAFINSHLEYRLS